VPRRDVYDEAGNLPFYTGLEVLTDGVEVPAGDEVTSWLDDLPRAADELAEVATADLGFY